MTPQEAKHRIHGILAESPAINIEQLRRIDAVLDQIDQLYAPLDHKKLRAFEQLREVDTSESFDVTSDA